MRELISYNRIIALAGRRVTRVLLEPARGLN